ncbi:UDP-glycosyltransferase 92A1 [Bienertia sinuspersici]
MEEKRREHVILFPFMAQGHIIPFLALALEIEKKKGYDITFINTPLNIKNLRPSLPSSSSIRFQEISFDASKHGLPPNTENTENLPYNLILHFLEVSVSLKPAFRDIVSNILQECKQPSCDLSPPLCIIGDFFFGWTAEIAREFNIFHSILVANSGFGIAIYYSLWTNIPHWKKEGVEDEFINDDFPRGGKIHVTQLPGSMLAANGKDSWSIYLGNRLPEWWLSNGIMFNTVEEIDEAGLSYFRRKLGLPVYAIGPILSKNNSKSYNNVSHECIKWLDKKPQKSVLYICFGSQNTLTVSQMMELALALEYTKRPFIWVIRPPLGNDCKSEFKPEKWLPKGFEKRMQEKELGFLVKNWAPQVEILSHKSVGGFVSHCGWNSVLEAISQGVPILGWPMAAEQFFNAKFLVEEVGICVEIGRGNGCKVNHEDLAKKIEILMGENFDAKKIRNRALKVKNIVEDAGKNELDFKGNHHLILFPFMAQGHLIPYSSLALELEHKNGYNITIINTPLNVKALKSYIPSSSSIRFKEIPFNSLDHGLPPNTENTNNLPLDLIYLLLEASTSLKPSFRKLVLDFMLEENYPPLCIIADFFYGWTADIAKEFDIHHSIFVGGCAYGMAFYYSLWITAPKWKVEGAEELESDDFFEGGRLHVTQIPAHLRSATGTDKWSVILRTKFLEWKDTNSLLFNTVEEIDEVGLSYFRRKLGVPVYPIGMIISNKNATITSSSNHQCLEWLDSKPPNSVLYICFGSQNTLKLSHMIELALALESIKRPFIWVVRPPLGTINQRVPVLGWPMSAEQFFNVKFLMEVGVCVEVGRGHHYDVKTTKLRRR